MKTVEELLAALELERIEKLVFRGQNHDMGSPNVFGGQVLSQALNAAMVTVDEDRVIHSLHGYFILPGNLQLPILFEVDPIRDGGSFTTRRVVAIQNGKAIFNLSASFQKKQEGLEHQAEMPIVTPASELKSDQELLASFGEMLPEKFKRWARPRPIEFRPVNPYGFVMPQKQDPLRYVWMRATGDIPPGCCTQERVLAYASDYHLLSTALLPHQHKVMAPQLQMASLDHAMWFHRPFDFSKWLLYAVDSPSASNSRGFTRGSFYTEEGVLVASVAQEGLMRKKRK